MDKAELLRLADRVEALSGPDRVVDCLIWCATAESHFEYHGGECVLAVQGGFSARLDWKDIKHPTASLDAAMTLAIRPDHNEPDFDLSRDQGGWTASVSLKELWVSDGRAIAATPALALTAAALRARSKGDE